MPTSPETQLAMTTAAVNGDTGQLYQIASRLMGEGMPFETLLFDHLLPVEREVGVRWQKGDYLVSEEHAATAAIETVISLLAGMFDLPSEGKRIVVSSAEGDAHSLPARALAAHLLFLGYRTTLLGADVLASDLNEFLSADPPDALVLSCSMTTHLPGARAVVRAAHEAGVPVLAGGNAFGPDGVWATRIGVDRWAGSLGEVSSILDTWSPDPSSIERAIGEPTEELRRFTKRRLEIAAAAISNLDDEDDPVWSHRLADEADLLIGSLQAALLVEDGRVVEEMLVWQMQTLQDHGLEDGSVVARALLQVLESFPKAAEMLGTAIDRLAPARSIRSSPLKRIGGMSTVTQLRNTEAGSDRLRIYNVLMGLLHAAQGGAVLALANDFALPVVATFMSGPPGAQPPSIEPLFDIRIAWGVALFLFLSAAAHFIIASPGVYAWYRANLHQKRNYARWIEYSLSSSVMVVLIALLVGIADIAALLGLAGVNASMILFGLLQEKYEHPGSDTGWLPFWFGVIAGAVPWVAIAFYLVSPGIAAEPPGFVYGIFFSLFAFFNVFAVVMVLQYRRVGRWADYVYGESTYVLLSLIAKSALAWQVFGGTLAA